MKSRLKLVAASAAAALVAGVGAVAIAPAAQAITPPWGADPAAVGKLLPYDASGNLITGGPLNGTTAAFYWVATGPTSLTLGTGAALTKLGVNAANPDPGNPVGAWTQDNTFTASKTPITTGLPASLQVPGITVIKPLAGESDIQLQLTNFVPSSNPQYGNKLQLRGVTANGSKYFLATVAVNPSAAPITATGLGGTGSVTVPANSWVLFDPDVNSTSTALTAAPSNQTAPAGPVTVTATVTTGTPATPVTSGNVTFTGIPGGPVTVAVNASGVATTTFTPPNPTGGGTSSTPVSASFSPVAPNTPTGPVYSSSAAPAPVNVTVGPPLANTATALSVNPATVTSGQNITATATVTTGTPATPVTAGTVQFKKGAANLGTPQPVNASGVATLVTNQLDFSAPGPTINQITAQFIPAGGALFNGSTSAAVPVSVTAPQCPGSTLDPVTGLPTGTPPKNPNVTLANGYTQAQVDASTSCVDPQTIQVVINPGTLTITTPYTPNNPFVLPAMTLDAATVQYTTSATFPKVGDAPITVTSTLAGNPVWTVSASCTDLTSPTPAAAPLTNVIDAQNVGLTAGVLLNGTGNTTPAPYNAPIFAQGVTFTDQPAAAVAVAPGAAGNAGLKGTGKTFAVSGAPAPVGGTGTAYMRGTLTVKAPTTSVQGTYTGTLTFTVA